MDTQQTITPVIRDFQALEEFAETLHDAIPGIERDISRLKYVPDDDEAVGNLFRALHNAKGDAMASRVDLAVAVIHPIETVLARLRDGKIRFGSILAEAILLAIDRLELTLESLIAREPLDNFHIPSLVRELENLTEASAADVETVAGKLIEAVTGFRPAAGAANFGNGQTPNPAKHSPTRIDGDLLFFRSLAEQIESRSPLFKGRTQRLLHLASETNRARNLPIDPMQLEAAIYMHDIGMMFLPESVWLKAGQMTPEERTLLRRHPAYAAGILARIPGWEIAAEMTAQHHEMSNGKGYPESLSSPFISDGAKILSIVDAFESIMLKHANRGRNRSVLRAIAEINACDNQFAPEWIEPFNQIIRRTINP
ncbi:MAG: HD domain-containing protein [Candidatus Accumulibacter sp.]|nr:HD domain-containing protein [Accumulibacter sp.]